MAETLASRLPVAVTPFPSTTHACSRTGVAPGCGTGGVGRSAGANKKTSCWVLKEQPRPRRGSRLLFRAARPHLATKLPLSDGFPFGGSWSGWVCGGGVVGVWLLFELWIVDASIFVVKL